MSRVWALFVAALAACDSGTGPQLAELQVGDTIIAARGDTVRLSVWADGALVDAEWRSLSPSVVTVTAQGLATAMGKGAARVRASVGRVESEGTVTVLPPVDIRLSELAVVTDPGGATGVGMRIRNLGGRGFYTLELWKLEPDGTKRRILRYTTETPAEAGLDVRHNNYLSGETPDWVVAYSREPMADEPVRTACVRLDGAAGCPSDLPDPPTVHSVLVTPAAALMAVGDSILYQARAYDENGVEIVGRTATWYTSSPGVIAIDQRGMAKALARGYGQVQATVDGVQAAVGLTVTDPVPVVDSVWVGPASRTVAVGDTVRYTARAFDAFGVELVDLPVQWSTSTPLVVSVGEGGLATALAAGQGVVVATVGGVSENVGLMVEATTVVDRVEVYSVGILFTGETFQFRGWALDAQGVPLDEVAIQWTSSDVDVVEAGEDGTMIARAPGWAVVEAEAGGVRERISVRVASERTDGIVVSALPTFGDPQLQVLTLGAAGQSRFVHQGAGLRNPVASPDASRFVFVMDTPDGGADLFLVNGDGSGLRRLTSNPGPDDQPAWSPDGRSIAFRSGVQGLIDIWVIEADGTGLRNLTDLGPIRIEGFLAERPAWSPDGAWVAYAWGDRNISPARMSLRMIRRDGSETRTITSLAGYEDTEPSFSPDGDRIVFRRNGGGMDNRILIADLSGNLMDPGADLGSGRTPRWSRDGDWLVYIRPVTGKTAPGAMILKRIGWGEERAMGAVADASWTPVR